MKTLVRRSALRLRTMVVGATVALGLLVAFVCASFVVLTTNLHSTADSLGHTVAGMRLAHESQVNLLRYERTRDPVERRELERELHAAMAQDFGLPQTTPEIRRDREVAQRQIERYLAAAPLDPGTAGASDHGAELAAAVDALDPIVASTSARADRAQSRAEHLDAIANTIAISAAVPMIVGLALLAWWTRRSLVTPIAILSQSIERFRAGDASARAEPRGPWEVQRVMHEFNFLAETVERQRRDRLTHLAGVAHDLRNPLGALLMSVDLLDADESLPPEAQIRRTFGLVRRQLTRLDRMVKDLLDATRIDAGQFDLEIRPTDLRRVVDDVVALFGDVSAVHRFEVELPDRPLVVACDPVRIEQVLSNLVSNAIKYSPEGGPIRIVARQRRDGVSLSVTDEGIGIREADLETIWEPFRRSGGSKESIPGVGLGLWTARRLVSAHHGELHAESTPGVGSTFTITLAVDPFAKPSGGAAIAADRHPLAAS